MQIHTHSGTAHVASILLWFRYKDRVTFVLPYFAHKHFREYYRQMDAVAVRNYMSALLSALAHLHKHGIVHRDVKPGNFLSDGRDRFLLVDYGLAQNATPTSTESASNVVRLTNMRGDDTAKESTTRPSQQKGKSASRVASSGSTGPTAAARNSTSNQKDSTVSADTKNRKRRRSHPTATSSFRIPRTPLRAGRQPLVPQDGAAGHPRRSPRIAKHRLQMKTPGLPLQYRRGTRSRKNMRLLEKQVSIEAQGGPPAEPRARRAWAGRDQKIEKRKENMFADVWRLAAMPDKVSPESLHGRVFPTSTAAAQAVQEQPAPARPVRSTTRMTRRRNRRLPSAARSGTRGFRAPEVLLRVRNQTTAIDVWSAGVILLSILSRHYPFYNSPDDLQALVEIGRVHGFKSVERSAKEYGREVRFHDIPGRTKTPYLRLLRDRLARDADNGWRADAFKLMSRCLDLSAGKRATAEMALVDEFLRPGAG